MAPLFFITEVMHKMKEQNKLKLIDMKKVKDGKYLKNYTLTYLNKNGKEKVYEMVSHSNLKTFEDIGAKTNGVVVVAYQEDKMLLLREFRMGVNRYVINLVAGFVEQCETLEECARREIYEETGLQVTRVINSLPPSYAAVTISDTKTSTIFVETAGKIADYTSENEDIAPKFYTREEVKELLRTEEFSAKAQIVSYFFAYGNS